MIHQCWSTCSAGVGRTGTFIAINLALDQVKEENAVDITGIVTRLRQQRMMNGAE